MPCGPDGLSLSRGHAKCDEMPGRIPALPRMISLSREGKEKRNSQKLNDRRGNVYENKRPLWKTGWQSGNLIENKCAYEFKAAILLKRKEVGGERTAANLRLGGVLIWDVGPGLAPARPPQGAAPRSNWDITLDCRPLTVGCLGRWGRTGFRSRDSGSRIRRRKAESAPQQDARGAQFRPPRLSAFRFRGRRNSAGSARTPGWYRELSRWRVRDTFPLKCPR